MHSDAATLADMRRPPGNATQMRSAAPPSARTRAAHRTWTSAELARDWSPNDPYDRWPVAIAVSDATGVRPVLIHDVGRTEAVVIVPGSPVSTVTVPIAALIPLADTHEAPRQFCVAVVEHAAPATLDHFSEAWDAATFAAVEGGRLVEPLEMH